MSVSTRLVHVCWYTDAKVLVSLPKGEQVTQKLTAFTRMVFDAMHRDKHHRSEVFYLKINDQSQGDVFEVTVFPRPHGPQSKCKDCGYESQEDQITSIFSNEDESDEDDERAPDPGFQLTAYRLHRIVGHSEFAPDEAKSERQLDLYHKFLFRTGAPVPLGNPTGDCQLQIQ
jgi:hypothetical protein